MLKAMKRATLITIAILAAVIGVIVAANWAVFSMLVFGPYMGGIAETWETSNQTFKVRVDRHPEENAFVGGAYYVFRSAPIGSNEWRGIMTFRHDDPVPVPRDQVRFVNDRVGYVFMGWMSAVTTDGGATWSVWSANKDLPNKCCNYGLIKDMHLQPDGTGVMILDPIPKRPGEVPELKTKDYGRHWSDS
jgi:photosystem II stability/assembly factor-like uncharacterized protein